MLANNAVTLDTFLLLNKGPIHEVGSLDLNIQEKNTGADMWSGNKQWL